MTPMHCELLSNLVIIGVSISYIYFLISLIRFSSWKVEPSLHGIAKQVKYLSNKLIKQN